MAARTTKIRHDDNTRTKIKVAELINRFHRHFMGQCELSPTQISAGKILLDRALPVLQSVEHSGEITKVYVARLPANIPNIDEWKKQTAATLQ